jgi:hypothetical protein
LDTSDRQRTNPLQRPARLALAIAVLALAACGSGDAPFEEGLAAAAPAPRAPAAGNDTAARKITSVRLVPDEPVAGGDVTAEVELSGQETAPAELRYEWRLAGETLNGGGRSLRLPSGSKGSLVEALVSIGDGPSPSSVGRASARVTNQRPVIHSVVLEPRDELSSGEAVTAIPRGEDADGDSLEYRFEWYVNDRIVPGASTNTLTQEHTSRGDRIHVVARANDGERDSERFDSDVISVMNSSPRIVSTPGAIGKDGVFRYAVAAEDPDGDRVLRYRLTKGPDGMAIDRYSGAVEWTPGEKQVGTHRVSIAVDDPHGGSGSQEIEVRVALEEPATPAAPAPARE